MRNIPGGENGIKFDLLFTNGRNHSRKAVSRIHTEQATIFRREQMGVRDLNKLDR
ncbi:TPA: hypothetical protein ACOAX4_002938 [Vibrio cholerae]